MKLRNYVFILTSAVLVSCGGSGDSINSSQSSLQVAPKLNSTEEASYESEPAEETLVEEPATETPETEIPVDEEPETETPEVEVPVDEDPTTETPEIETPVDEAPPITAPQNTWTCPEDGSLYFCDDFEDGSYEDKWENLIAGYELASPGEFDILDEGNNGKSLRFTANVRGANLNEGELILVKDSELGNLPDNYFVEYRVRPRNNGNTGNKYLYAMLRYQGPLEWYFGGLNMQSSPSSTQVESGFIDTGSVIRSLQSKSPIELGTKNDLGTDPASWNVDGNWYTVRTDVVSGETGTTLTAYLNGEELGSWEDTANTYASAGRIGFFTYNRSFEVDYIKVGDPAVKPVQLLLDYSETVWQSAVRGDTLEINVNAIQSDGVTPDTFTAAASDENIVSVEVEGSKVTLTPIAQGTATVSFTAASDPSVVRLLDVVIEPAWEMPLANYGDIDARLSPIGADAYTDTRFTIEFDSDSAITLGSTGEVRIFDAEGELVDRIKVGNEIEEVGYAGAPNVRQLNTELITLRGNTLSITPHSQSLDYNSEYTLAIGVNVVNGAKLNGSEFSGLGENANWTITTKSAAPEASVTSLYVDNSGTNADFYSLQGALDWLMERAAVDEAFVDTPFTIFVAEGVYEGLYYLRNKNALSIQGSNPSRSARGDSDLYNPAGKTVIQGKNYERLNGGSSGRALFLVEGVDMLTLDSLTLYNTHVRSGSGDQAETLYFNSNNGRLIARNSQFISEQDTLQLKGYNWFYKSLVAGNVDFIWGGSVASVFEKSEIRSLGDSKVGSGESSGGYIMQARSPDVNNPGFVFVNSVLTSGAGPLGVTITPGSSYLARSGGSSSYFDNVTFINTRMGPHIAEAGWAYEGINSQPAPNPSTATASTGWKEFNSQDSRGVPIDMSKRCGADDSTNGKPANCYQLSAKEAQNNFCSLSQIFASFDNNAGWDPLGKKRRKRGHCFTKQRHRW